MTDFETAMRDPGACVRRPEEVLREDWMPHQKYHVLRQWKYELGQLAVATEENMPDRSAGTSGVELAEIHRAIEALGYSPEEAHDVTKGD